MQVSLPIKVLFAGALLSATAILIWRSNAAIISHSSAEVHQDPGPPTRAALALRVSPASAQSIRPASTSKVSMRAQFRESGNYAEFVRGLARAATAGDPIAEYLTARALKYCHDNAHLSLQKSGALQTRDELEMRLSKFPVDLQQELLEAYDRCHEFFAVVGQADATSAWESWLDQASAAGYPPAQSLKADVSRQADLMRDASNAANAANLSSGDVVPPTMGPARDLALTAVLSGNPDSIFEMMNWVDGTKHSTEDYGYLSGAWGLLACQRGYDDCGPTSQWLRSVCSWDAQCADGNSVIDTLKRQFGSRFDDVQNLANSIGLAIDQKDQKAVESFL